MIDYLMRIVAGESIVGKQRISIECGASFDVFLNFGLKSLALGARNNDCANLAAALHDAHDGSFIFGSGSGNPTLTFANVHVPCFATDEGLVSFDLARELIEGTRVQSEADTVSHVPSGFL